MQSEMASKSQMMEVVMSRNNVYVRNVRGRTQRRDNSEGSSYTAPIQNIADVPDVLDLNRINLGYESNCIGDCGIVVTLDHRELSPHAMTRSSVECPDAGNVAMRGSKRGVVACEDR
jgi:hypothetical protein